MDFLTVHQALKATRKFHRAYGLKGHTYKARRSAWGGKYITVGVFARGKFVTLV